MPTDARRPRIRVHTLAIVAWACTMLLGATGALAQDLSYELQRVIADSKVGSKLNLSVTILDARTGEVLADKDPEKPMIPASNMKLLTSGAALRVLGPDFEFLTELVLFRGDGPRGSDRLVVRGSGDPAFADFELLDEMGLSVEDFIALWVDAIERAGVADSVGEIVVDARIFDRELVHESWPEAQLNRWYCAQVSGVNFHANVLRIYTRPTEPGQRPIVQFEPELPWLEITNKAKTVGRGKNHTVWASRAIGTNHIGLHADVRHATTPLEVTVHEPGMILGRVIASRLAERGHSEPPVRFAEANEDLSGGETIHTVRTPIGVVLERCNTDSHNLYAEALIKRTGAEASRAQGSWTRGGYALRALLVEELGPEIAQRAVIADGSGMSRKNRVTTLLLARWLRSMRNDKNASAAFIESLPIAGETGTLEKRFSRSRPEHTVRGKTGYLSGVSALSGYVTDEDTGRAFIFSIISNDKPKGVALRSVRELEEDIVLMLDEQLSEMAGTDTQGG